MGGVGTGSGKILPGFQAVGLVKPAAQETIWGDLPKETAEGVKPKQEFHLVAGLGEMQVAVTIGESLGFLNGFVGG
jgi:hypothetical protein